MTLDNSGSVNGKPAFTLPPPRTSGLPTTAPARPAATVGVSTPAKRPSLPTAPTLAKGPSPKKPAFIAKKVDDGPSSEKFLFELLDECGDTNVSDLHVQPGNGMWRLVQGKLTHYGDEAAIVTEDDIVKWLEHSDNYAEYHLDSPEKLLEPKGHTTVAFATGKWRVRGSFRKSTAGISCTFRLIPSKIPTVQEVGVPEIIQAIARRTSGLILIEGPTGSGKTTSIAALINQINENTDQHIYSIEDPIEFHHKPKGATIFTMREIGIHATDYPSAVENALRSKPNIIFVGEMLDNDTKKAALHAATTGHLVITTAHAGSVAEAIDSFIGGFSADEQPQIRSRLAQSLLAVMCQKLLPGVNGRLVAAREVMITNLNFAEIISDGKMNMLHGQMNSTPDSYTLEDDLLKLVEEQKITVKTALEEAKRPDALTVELQRKNISIV